MKKLFLLTFLFPIIALSQDLSKIELKDVAGNKFIMKDHLDNDATVVLFWATWCIPCKEEFKAVQNLQQKHPDKKIKVITISQDSPRSLAKVKSFVKTHNYDFIYLLDPNKEVSNRLLVDPIPHSLLVDQHGKVIYSHTGYRKGDEVELEKEMIKYWNQTIKLNKRNNE